MGQILSIIQEKLKQLALAFRKWIIDIVDSVLCRIQEIISHFKSFGHQPGGMTEKDVFKKEMNQEIDKLPDIAFTSTGMSKDEFRQRMNQEIDGLPNDCNFESWRQFFQ